MLVKKAEKVEKIEIKSYFSESISSESSSKGFLDESEAWMDPLNHFSFGNILKISKYLKYIVQNPFNFDADPDPGSVLEKQKS